ncbi:MAG TPA: hypothetical protein VFH89_11670 [Sphingomicrobium sp.]|nr:hypothetical protein [Sphingomicrobium sp.]
MSDNASDKGEQQVSMLELRDASAHILEQLEHRTDALRQTHSNEADALIEELQATIAEIYRAVDKLSGKISSDAARKSAYAAGRKPTEGVASGPC